MVQQLVERNPPSRDMENIWDSTKENSQTSTDILVIDMFKFFLKIVSDSDMNNLDHFKTCEVVFCRSVYH